MESKFKLQDLQAKQAHFCLNVCHFLEEIQFELKDKKCLVALSGGADSTALLLFLILMQEKYSLEISALHIDHALREVSASEAQEVRTLCKEMGINCKVRRIDIEDCAKTWKKGIEESARIARYTALEEERQALGYDYIFLGHHLNDLAEDVLMRQIRGTSLEQSIGMQALDTQRKICRPFLLVEKKELFFLLESCHISWLEDASNSSDIYLRNRVRNTILPLFLEENPSFLESIKNNWLQGQVDKKYWQEKTADYPITIDNNSTFTLNRKDFCQEEQALRLRVLTKIIKAFSSQPQAQQVFSLDTLLTTNQSNKEMHINKKLKIHISKHSIVFKKH